VSLVSQSVIGHCLEVASRPRVGHRIISTTETHDAFVTQAHQVIDCEPGAGHIVVTDHVHAGDSNVVTRHGHGGYFAGDLLEHVGSEAVGDEDQSLDLKLLKGVDFRSFQCRVFSAADQHGGEPVLSDLCLDTIEDFGKNRVVEIKDQYSERPTLFGYEASGGGVWSISELSRGPLNF
jgi:hypothetical protein